METVHRRSYTYSPTMRELTADIFTSLDGFASGMHQPPYFGCLGPDLAAWVERHLAKPQVILMGRVTYDALVSFAPSATDEVSIRMSQLPKIVFSNKLKDPLPWQNTHVIQGALEESISQLKRQPGDPLRSIGSIRLVNGLLQFGLVDRLRLMIFPLILGSAGREPIFARIPQLKLELVESKVLDGRLTLLEYRPTV